MLFRSMDQPIGFEVKEQGRKVCCLKCSIYDLKQASRQWYFKFHKAIILIGFEMKDMGKANYVLGVNISRDHSKKLLGLSQET